MTTHNRLRQLMVRVAHLEKRAALVGGLEGRDLSGRNLKGINFSNTNLYEANLSGADLRGANLTDANFGRTNLRGADLTGVQILRTTFTGVKYNDQTKFPLTMTPAHLATMIKSPNFFISIPPSRLNTQEGR